MDDKPSTSFPKGLLRSVGGFRFWLDVLAERARQNDWTIEKAFVLRMMVVMPACYAYVVLAGRVLRSPFGIDNPVLSTFGWFVGWWALCAADWFLLKPRAEAALRRRK